jgi:Zn-dependent M28 family amino/carboxypeptidase
LGMTLQQVVARHRDLRMTPIRDRWPEERIFYRSDHYNFARNGVPILFFTSGTHLDYHQPSDTPDRINGEKASRLVQLLFHLSTAVANQPQRPRWSAASYRQIVERK